MQLRASVFRPFLTGVVDLGIHSAFCAYSTTSAICARADITRSFLFFIIEVQSPRIKTTMDSSSSQHSSRGLGGGHKRGQSIFSSLSGKSSSGTYAKRAVATNKSAAAQSYSEKMAWKDAVTRPVKPIKLEKLEIDPQNMGTLETWEKETTTVLRQITNESTATLAFDNTPITNGIGTGTDTDSSKLLKDNSSTNTLTSSSSTALASTLGSLTSATSTPTNAPPSSLNAKRLSRLAKVLSTASTSSNSSRDTVILDKRASEITIKSNRSSIHESTPATRNSSLQQRTRRAAVAKSYSHFMDIQDSTNKDTDEEDPSFRISDDEDDEEYTKRPVGGLRIPSSEHSVPRTIPLRSNGPTLKKTPSPPHLTQSIGTPTATSKSPTTSSFSSGSSPSNSSPGHLRAERSIDFSLLSKKSTELTSMRHNNNGSGSGSGSALQTRSSRRGLSLTPSILSLKSTSSVASSMMSTATDGTYAKKKIGHAHKLSTTLGQLAKKTSLENVKRFIRSGSTSSLKNVEISLPTPSDSSREKLSNKLRGANSILTLTKSEGTNGLTVGVPLKQYEETQLGLLLSLCTSPSVQPFNEYVQEFIRSQNGHFSKLAEASFSEVYLHEPANSDEDSTIYKIVPFGDEDMGQMPAKDIIQELQIAKMLMTLPGYGYLRHATIVQGHYPQQLLDLWDAYNDENPSENERPDEYKASQYYCIMAMDDAGVDLEHYELSSWEDGEAIFWQTCRILASGELKYQFEHRDLHWGNIVISDVDNQVKVTLIDYTLSRALSPRSRSPLYTRMDHPDFFRGREDYQFDIYRFMRAHVSATSKSNPPDWSVYSPQTNVMWLHYLVDKLLNGKGLVRRKSKSYDVLELLNNVLDPTSSGRRDHSGPGSATFVDFGCANDVLNWAAAYHLV